MGGFDLGGFNFGSFGAGNSWIWIVIVIIVIFCFSGRGFNIFGGGRGCDKGFNLFGGSSWWVIVILAIFLIPNLKGFLPILGPVCK